MSKLWGGRFEKETHKAVEVFTASIQVDARLWEVDIIGSIAHARMLGAQNILPQGEVETIVQGLEAVRSEIRLGFLTFNPNAEDVHSEIEKFLTDKIGPVAGKLHTARSRNDQVATDTRLYLRGQIDEMTVALKELSTWLVVNAEKHLQTILPGLTHTQHAQPVSLAHHLLAYFWMFQRDRERLVETRHRVNVLPLGSAAMAGTSFPLDRQMVARELGFERVSENSLDAVSDRDFCVEFLSHSSLIMMHLSRLAEELIYWSTPEFGFIQLDDSVTTGSSIMPQKKNPDVAELIRGKVGRAYGALMGTLTMLKALPLAYNRDLQEDKQFLFDGLDTTLSSIKLTLLMLETADFKAERMQAALLGDFSNATDLADYLVRKGLPFRQAHEVVGKTVRYCIETKTPLEKVSLEALKLQSPLFESDVLPELQHLAVMEARSSEGGTGSEAVKAQLHKARMALIK